MLPLVEHPGQFHIVDARRESVYVVALRRILYADAGG